MCAFLPQKDAPTEVGESLDPPVAAPPPLFKTFLRLWSAVAFVTDGGLELSVTCTRL